MGAPCLRLDHQVEHQVVCPPVRGGLVHRLVESADVVRDGRRGDRRQDPYARAGAARAGARRRQGRPGGVDRPAAEVRARPDGESQRRDSPIRQLWRGLGAVQRKLGGHGQGSQQQQRDAQHSRRGPAQPADGAEGSSCTLQRLEEASQGKSARAGEDQAAEDGGLGPELERGRAEQHHREEGDEYAEDKPSHLSVGYRARVGDHEEREDQDLG